MSLAQALKEKKDKSASTIPEEKYKVMMESTAKLKRDKIAEKALKTGEKLPVFKLPDATGNIIHSGELLKESKLIISFYRGGWCPYCNLELKALQDHVAEFKDLGAHLVAISLETPDHSSSTVEKNNLSFTVLSDENNEYAKKLGLIFEMPDDLRHVYSGYGLDVAKHNGNNDFELPMPATFIIDQNAIVVEAFVPEDYTERLDPEDILKVLRK